MKRYDQSGWRVGLLQSSYSLNGARQVRGQGRRWDFCGVTDPLLSWRESVLVVKGINELENAEVNSKYHDKAEGQRPRNFI
ncbi:hypothetical protein BHE74_00034370 [Ensete ventricosum]|nr:hypothetical protein BHE74_00034370 [Ensete ventricosum]